MVLHHLANNRLWPAPCVRRPFGCDMVMRVRVCLRILHCAKTRVRRCAKVKRAASSAGGGSDDGLQSPRAGMRDCNLEAVLGSAGR